jgi:hypothetical protein
MFTESQSSTYDLFSGKDEEQIKFMEVKSYYKSWFFLNLIFF